MAVTYPPLPRQGTVPGPHRFGTILLQGEGQPTLLAHKTLRQVSWPVGVGPLARGAQGSGAWVVGGQPRGPADTARGL